MKKTAVVVLALCTFLSVPAQTNRGRISITIINDQQSALENATVELLKVKDSSLVKAAITDKNGLAEFENVRFGNYLLRVSMVNYSGGYSSSFELSGKQAEISVPEIILHAVGKQLGNVTVTGRKPFIQKLNDRIVTGSFHSHKNQPGYQIKHMVCLDI